ncbi:MAG: arylesterase [Hyphomicrobiaceae bacterium]|nr:arylesterase [Hyphomicrobiaceae bacterium]
MILTHRPGEAGAGTGAAAPIRIVAFGDSLTAGYGLRPGQSFPEVLEAALKSRGHRVEVVNAGVSGDTTAAGLERFEWAVGADADAVIVELGANDALRGLPPDRARDNLDRILAKISERGLPLLVAGMRSPENWGGEYRDAFARIFPDLANKHDAILYPFFLDGVALDPKLNLADGLHPNARGVTVIVERILPDVERLIARVEAQRAQRQAGKG